MTAPANTRHFLNTQDWSRADLDALLAQATAFKRSKAGEQLKGKSIALVFFNPSMRTRTSFELGAFQLGGHAVVLQPGKDAWPIEFNLGTVMDGDTEEHIAEVAKVLGRYVDLIGVRAFPKFVDWTLRPAGHRPQRLRQVSPSAGDQHGDDHPSVPGAGPHPRPAGALRHHHLRRKKYVLTWTYHPKPLNTAVANSALTDRHAHGHGRDAAVPDAGLHPRRALHGLGRRRTSPRDGGSLTSATTSKAAYTGADVVYAKSWGAMPFFGNWGRKTHPRPYQHFIVDEAEDGADQQRLSSAIACRCAGTSRRPMR